MNLIISIVYILLSFSLTVICFKKLGKIGLFIWMCILVIICNIQTLKLIDFFGYTISLGNISYGAIFLTTDILSEIYGFCDAKKAVKLSFVTMIIFTIFMFVFLQYIPSSSDTTQRSLEIVFNYMPRITIASLLAYLVSQQLDIKIYKYLKNKYNKVWLSNNISTIISQVVDTIIFVSISFYGSMNFETIISLLVTMIIIKTIISIIDTPFIYISKKIKPNEIK